MKTLLPLICFLAIVLFFPACYFSGDRNRGDRTDTFTEDVVVDGPLLDVPEDIVPETVEPPCLYEPEGVRQLVDTGHTSEAPHLVWTGSEVGVVMFEGGGDMIEHSYVSLATLTPDLGSQHGPVRVGEESHGWGEPAWTGEALGLCWHLDPGFVSRTGFRLHDARGERVSERVDLDFDGEACLGLVWGDGRFLAAWRHYHMVGDEYWIDTRVQVLDGTGHPVGEPMDMAFADYPGVTPSLVYTGEEFLVSLAGEDAIELTWIDAAGTALRRGIVSVDGPARARIAWRDGLLALAWLTGERGERGLRMTVVDGERLVPVGEELLLEEDGAGAHSAQVVAVDDGWVMTWAVGEGEEARAMLLHVDPEGNPRQPRTRIVEGHNSGYGGPSSVSVGGRLFTGLSYYPGPGEWLEQVFLHAFTCVPGEMDVCAAQDAEVSSLDICESPIHFGWKWDGASCQEVVGCSCVGVDCEALAASRWDCLSDRQTCG
jgi:hypothetical protein